MNASDLLLPVGRQATGTWGLALALCLGFFAAHGAEEKASFHVATDGNDANPGTEAKPFASLEAARDAVRKLAHREQPVRVWIRGGLYQRDRGFELGARDAGTPDAPTIYESYPGEVARLVGGRALRGWKPVTDESVLKRLPQEARTKVLVADLSELSATAFGGLSSRGFGRPSSPSHSELFYAGQPMTLARWPNEGAWEKIAGYPEASAQPDSHGGKYGDLKAGFRYAGDRPRGWQSSTNIWVHGYWAWDWANSYERIEVLDPAERLVKTAPPYGHYGFRPGQRIYFLNILEELDQPGEWFLDTATRQVYFWPPGPIEGAEITLSLLDQPMVTLDGTSHVRLRGLVIDSARGQGIVIRGGSSNRVEGCWLRLLGNCAVTVEGGRGHVVSGCDIEQTGDGGVVLNGGDRQTLTPGGHVVEHCHFQKQGRWSKCYVPAVLLGGVGHRVAHNLIHDHPHCAVLFTGNDHVIEYNEIHHVALETGDVGAIYTGRDWTFRGNIARGNYIHHVGGVGMGAMGIYNDDCVSGTEMYDNVFHKVSRAAFLGGGRDHKVINNIFIECTPAVAVDGRGLDQSPVWNDMVYGFMKRQLDAMPTALYRERYPAIQEVDRYYAQAGKAGIPPEGNVVANNISVGGKWLEVGWHAKTNHLEVRDNLVDQDPKFVDAANGNFRLQADSPAFKLGFKAIPMDEIGSGRNAERELVLRARAKLGP